MPFHCRHVRAGQHRIFRQVKGGQLRESLAVFGEQEVERLPFFAVLADRNRDVVVVRQCGIGMEVRHLYLVIERQARTGADRDFDAAGQLRGQTRNSRVLSTAARQWSKHEEQSKGCRCRQSAKARQHNPLIIAGWKGEHRACVRWYRARAQNKLPNTWLHG